MRDCRPISAFPDNTWVAFFIMTQQERKVRPSAWVHADAGLQETASGIALRASRSQNAGQRGPSAPAHQTARQLPGLRRTPVWPSCWPKITTFQPTLQLWSGLATLLKGLRVGIGTQIIH